ncbi:CheR family methyltransferase [Pseudomarimonas salicorniae]|uniref:Chemotaxis protein methyltransferase n=1 Tax=Pseudomarimonas salicorniae TaxID=2933270 RepID=A0ABT0GKP8_9GAMM|nr:CheR family methyltransferase [Lysobacter sp. CAU 1642]MCK7595119.1 chemotaxis protein CheR [Lysobacter sp. CAU 1642]
MADNAHGREFDFSERDFRRVCDMIYKRAGIALADSKRDMVYSRLSRRLRALGLRSFQEYLQQLDKGGEEEWEAFTNALTTNLTSFFREAHHFEILLEHLKARRDRGPLRIWCSAASTGEEPWSLAITACEAFNSLTPPVRILATDIDTQVLATGERGVYPVDRIKDLSAERTKRFFQRGTGPNEGMCRIKPPLRDMVEFAQLNLLAGSYGLKGPFDAIFCRNVMIYFDKPTQRGVLERMTPLLAPDGRLFAGHSESFLHANDLLRPCGRTVYCRADAPQ